ncbi:MAG: hypothetical protein Q9218_005092 [Villophora microphyllina]
MPSTTLDRDLSHGGVSAEVVVAIAFGIVMFAVALLTLWQGRRHRRHTGDTESQSDRSATPTKAMQRIKLPLQQYTPWPVLNYNTYFNG